MAHLSTPSPSPLHTFAGWLAVWMLPPTSLRDLPAARARVALQQRVTVETYRYLDGRRR